MASYIATQKRQETKNAKKNAAIASGSETANERVKGVDAEDVYLILEKNLKKVSLFNFIISVPCSLSFNYV